MPTVALHTLGCKLNFAETGMLERQFRERDFAVVPFGSPADVTVINTCTVTNEADRKSRQTIRKAVRASMNGFVIVTGCYAQLRPEEIAAIPGVDAILGTGEKHRLFHLVDSFAKGDQTQIRVSCIDDVEAFGPAFAAGERTRAFLKIQDGCDYSCAFCTIPMARGGSRSQPVGDTVQQAHQIATEGYREIVLSGVNIGLFGADTGDDLPALLSALDEVDGIERYRISSIEPNLLTDEIIDFVATSRCFAPHFHLPLQSGDNEVLGKMRRRYRRELYTDRVERIRSLLPDAAIGVDVIVGFPYETLDRFANSASFIADLPVSYLHVFTYSERDGTAAVEDVRDAKVQSVSVRERSRRSRILRQLSARKREEFSRRFLGTSRPVLWEDKVRGGYGWGFTDNYIRVGAPSATVRAGTVQHVVMGSVGDDGSVVAAMPDASGVPAYSKLLARSISSEESTGD